MVATFSKLSTSKILSLSWKKDADMLLDGFYVMNLYGYEEPLCLHFLGSLDPSLIHSYETFKNSAGSLQNQSKIAWKRACDHAYD
jgi:hypothetical protein